MANTEETPVLSVRGLKQYFRSGVGKNKLVIKAVDDISFDIHKGEVFSLVGESGCGKTTTGRTIIRLYEPTDGEVYFMGQRIGSGYMRLKDAIKRTKRVAHNKIKEIKLEMKDKMNDTLDKPKGQKDIFEAVKLKKALKRKFNATKKEYNLTEREQLVPKLKDEYLAEVEEVNKRLEAAKEAYAKDKVRSKKARSEKTPAQVAEEKAKAEEFLKKAEEKEEATQKASDESEKAEEKEVENKAEEVSEPKKEEETKKAEEETSKTEAKKDEEEEDKKEE
jgi:ABC-type oligopeptide transport system ATPase subunit